MFTIKAIISGIVVAATTAAYAQYGAYGGTIDPKERQRRIDAYNNEVRDYMDAQQKYQQEMLNIMRQQQMMQKRLYDAQRNETSLERAQREYGEAMQNLNPFAK